MSPEKSPSSENITERPRTLRILGDCALSLAAGAALFEADIHTFISNYAIAGFMAFLAVDFAYEHTKTGRWLPIRKMLQSLRKSGEGM
ncbi:MAG TPA: hypothetical protein VFB03_02665 [Candidatus Saccharimonadales bacterium]|nr:hypothetical protein [Candidatus Saccharimonadales bacterium]